RIPELPEQKIVFVPVVVDTVVSV
ncbi:MAG: hypothetical protein CFH38_00233, partial [Alphaproteobacteria bacterium MarineAlpha10_Bin1]